MTGMIHSGRVTDICPGCGQNTTIQDWTCARCGRILDRYLFQTITPKSVGGADKEAFRAGYKACFDQWKLAESVEIDNYCPVSGHETAYRAGWQHAADKIEAKQERGRGRRRGLQMLGVGILLTLAGGGLLFGSHPGDEGTPAIILAAGVLNLVLGLVSLLTGMSDAVPPPPPGVTIPPQSEEPSLTNIKPLPALPAEVLPASFQAPRSPIPLTPIVLALNVAVIVAMLLAGNNIFEPSAAALIRWGANYGPRTVTAAEWWRLLTSMFLHVGVAHIAFNMFALWQIGPLIERLFSRVGFALIYLIAGLCGGMASLAWNPHVAGAGASGAIFGLYGALFGFLLLHRRAVPPPALAGLTKGALGFVGYNLIYGLTNPQVDMAAHVGGLAGGFLCGLACALPFSENGRAGWRVRYAQVAVAAAVLLVGFGLKLPRPVDILAYLKNWQALQTRTFQKYNAGIRQFQQSKGQPAELAGFLDRQAFPEWLAVHDDLARVRHMTPQQAHVIGGLVRYMDKQHEAWLALARAMIEGKPEQLKDAQIKQIEAVDAARDLTRKVR